MQELLLGSLGIQLLGFVSRYPWQVLVGVLVATLIVVELLLKQSGSTAGADIELGDIGCGDGDGGRKAAATEAAALRQAAGYL